MGATWGESGRGTVRVILNNAKAERCMPVAHVATRPDPDAAPDPDRRSTGRKVGGGRTVRTQKSQGPPAHARARGMHAVATAVSARCSAASMSARGHAYSDAFAWKR